MGQTSLKLSGGVQDREIRIRIMIGWGEPDTAVRAGVEGGRVEIRGYDAVETSGTAARQTGDFAGSLHKLESFSG